MKSRVLVILFLIALTAFGNMSCGGGRVSTPYRRTAVMDVSFFYDHLSPYGRWFMVDTFGWVWTPYGVPFGWRPYTRGHWVYTDFGWTWVSGWNWGWAPFHYGRWTHHNRHGWIWIPGTVWGPAWVAWRHRPGWVGWAPLPPHAGWRQGVGLTIGPNEIERSTDSDWYSFVEEQRLTSRELDRHIQRADRNLSMVRDSRDVTAYSATDNRVVNRGIDVDRFERDTRQKVRRQKVVESAQPRGDQDRGADVVVFRPRLEDRKPATEPRTVESLPPDARAREERKIEKDKQRLEAEAAAQKAQLEKQKYREEKRLEQQRAEAERVRVKQEQKERKKEERKKPPENSLNLQPAFSRIVSAPSSATAMQTPSRRESRLLRRIERNAAVGNKRTVESKSKKVVSRRTRAG